MPIADPTRLLARGPGFGGRSCSPDKVELAIAFQVFRFTADGIRLVKVAMVYDHGRSLAMLRRQ